MDQNLYQRPDYKRTRIAYFAQCDFSYLGSVLLSETFLAKYLTSIGFSDALTGIVSSLATFSNIIMLLTIFLINRTKNMKKTVMICFTINMILFTLLYLLPFFDLSRPLLVVLVFICVGAGYAIKNLGNPLLIRWIMFFVDPRKRSDFSGINIMVSVITGIPLSLGAGLVVDRYAESGNMTGAYRFLAILLAVFTLLDVLSFTLMKNVSSEETLNQRKSPGEVIRLTFKRKGFRCLLAMRVLYITATSFTAGFVGTFLLDDLGFSFSLTQVMTIIGSVVWLALCRPAGYYADHTTYNRGYRLGMSVAAAAFFVLIFAKPSCRFLAVIYLLFYRASLAGTGVAQENLLFNYVPADCFAQAMAITGVVCGIFGFLSALVAGKLLSAIQTAGNTIFGIPVYAQNVLALVSFLLIIAAVMYSKFVLDRQEVEKS